MELEQLAQKEVGLIEQLLRAQYPIDLSKYRLKSVKVSISSSQKGSYTLHEVRDEAGLLLHALIDTDGDGMPQYSFTVDGTHLFPDMNTLSPHRGVSPALLRNYGYKSIIHSLMPTLLVDEATPKYVIDYTPQPPVPFHSSLKVEYHDQTGTAANITLFLWWLEERVEAGLSSQIG